MLFRDVLVDENLKQQLISLVKNNRISHAQLFLGPAGSHKFALAIAYAQYILCANRGDEDSCGTCPSCVKFAKLAHPDLHLIFPDANTDSKKSQKGTAQQQAMAKFINFVTENDYHLDYNQWSEGESKQLNINANDCSFIVHQNNIRSYESGYKIFILWMAERLYHGAAPRLLKTLEEPENKTLFILIAENSEKILPTILSRTQLIKIPKLSKETIKSELQNKFNVNERTADDIAEISEGNYIKAIELLNDSEAIELLLDDFKFILESAVAHARNDIQNIRFIELQERFTKIIAEGREKQKQFIRYMIQMFRNILLVNSNKTELLRATTKEKNILSTFTPYIKLRNISPITEACNKAILYIERNGNSSLIFNNLYFNIANRLQVR